MKKSSEWSKHIPNFNNNSFAQADPSFFLQHVQNAICSAAPVVSQAVYQASLPQPIITAENSIAAMLQQSNQQVDSFIHQAQMATAIAKVPVVSIDISQQAHLNAIQVAARHVMSKDLPVFSGQPEEWPIFISCFDTTTSTCGFTHTENMIRLQRCLKGRALETVRSKLLIPTMAPDVISTLNMLFRRPELINKLDQSRQRK